MLLASSVFGVSVSVVLVGWVGLVTFAGVCVFARPALAERVTTREALDRVEEILSLRIEDGTIDEAAILPALVVSLQPRFTESQGWFATAALSSLARSLPRSGLRRCEACEKPRLVVASGHLEQTTGPLGVAEIARIDAETRGDAAPARSAIWLDEHQSGVALRIIDIATGRVLFAQNVDPELQFKLDSSRTFLMADELERRARGEAISQVFFDAAVFPGQHIAFDWTEQWGAENSNLTGVVLSIVDPVVGLGVAHYYVLDTFNVMVGGKVIASVPTALTQSLSGEDIEVLDPLLTGVLVAKVPFGRSNYGGIITISTNGAVGVGISLMNVSLLPLLP